jgi:N-methylhydantoinase B/oxoprolinase/acetone carboxylase alpha subunit
MALVTLAQVNSALRLDLIDTTPDFAGDDRTEDIKLKIKQAEDIVLDFIQPKPLVAWTENTVPGRVSAAIILAVSCLLDDTDERLAMLSGLSGTIPADARNPIAALLWRLRDPSLA